MRVFWWTWVSLQITYMGLLSMITTLTVSNQRRLKRIESILSKWLGQR